MRIQIKGGMVLDPASASTDNRAKKPACQDLFLVDGKIAGMGIAPAGFLADRVLDARGKTIAPGLVDLSARLSMPDRPHARGHETNHETSHEMTAAAAGGITSLVCPPDGNPLVDQAERVATVDLAARRNGGVRLYPLGALTVRREGKAISDMARLIDAGCIGLSQGDQLLPDEKVLLHVLRYAGALGYTVWLRPELASLAVGGVVADGPLASRLGLPGVPEIAETLALRTIFELVRVTGARVHLSHLSSAAGVALVRAAKAEGLPLTSDVTIHHVHLVDVDVGYFDSQYRFAPPLRGTRDRDAIRAGLIDGTIDAICSDHTPLPDFMKRLPFAEAGAGASGLEFLLALTVKWAEEARLPLAMALSKITSSAAAIAGLPGGHIGVGKPADLCIFDADGFWQVDRTALSSRGHNTPFHGFELPAPVHATLVGARFIFERGA